jgi:hypothetical protein
MAVDTTFRDSRAMVGSLTIDGEEYNFLMSSVAIKPAGSKEAPTEVLSGELIYPPNTPAATLSCSAISDFLDPTGLVAKSWKFDDQVVPFEFVPNKAYADIVYTGTVQVGAIEIGGEVNKLTNNSFDWGIVTLVDAEDNQLIPRAVPIPDGG